MNTLPPANHAQIPLALYIHIPWCIQKCPYCDFNSHTLRGKIPETEYVAALLADLDFELAHQPEQRALVSIFFGGGTPSVFTGAAIGAILTGVAQRLAFSPAIEITLEANPGTVDAQRFADFRAAGINRLSMGVQSLHDPHLKALGRIHGAAEAITAYRAARASGFANINLDMMFALPEQTLTQAHTDLSQLIALAPEHISYYHLTLEPNTVFAASPPPLPDDDSAYAMLEQGQNQLQDAGYRQYETSAYAQNGRAAQHNLNYWNFGDYLGIGAGAHGKRSQAGASGLDVVRRARHKHPKTYLQTAGYATAVQEDRSVSGKELAFEYCLNALRLHQGFRKSAFTASTGLPISALEKGLVAAHAKGLIEEDADSIRPSERGRAHLNALLLEFL